MLEHVSHVSCLECGEEFRPSRRVRCPSCARGGRLRYAYKTSALAPFDRRLWARREPWLWRFRELLPFDEDLDPPPLQVGMTPLYGSTRLAARCGVRGLFVKDESANPGRTVIGRAAALCCAGAAGQRMIAAALAPEVAAFAASAQQSLRALATSDDALRTAAAYGADVARLLPGALAIEDALEQATQAGLYLADSANPLFFEGLKTLGLELGDQLAERMPDWIVLDAGWPDLVEAVKAGLQQLVELEVLRASPRILAVGQDAHADASVKVELAESQAAAEAMTRALGFPVDNGSGVAALQRAVREGLVPADALALVIAEGPPARLGDGLPPVKEVRNSHDLRAWLELEPADPGRP